MTKKKIEKDLTVNVESHGHGNTHIDVYTKCDRYGNIYYLLHIGNCNKNGKWSNNTLLVKEKDVFTLQHLLKKSSFFVCSLPKRTFATAKNHRSPKEVVAGDAIV